MNDLSFTTEKSDLLQAIQIRELKRNFEEKLFYKIMTEINIVLNTIEKMNILLIIEEQKRKTISHQKRLISKKGKNREKRLSQKDLLYIQKMRIGAKKD